MSGANDYVDVSLIDGVRRQTFFKKAGGETVFCDAEDVRLEAEILDQLQEIIGDGKASVSVGADLKTSVDYGNQAGCTVYVKLTCDQSIEGVERAHSLATELATRYADEGHKVACVLLNEARFGPSDDEPQDTQSPDEASPRMVAPKGRKRPKFKKEY